MNLENKNFTKLTYNQYILWTIEIDSAIFEETFPEKLF